MLRPLVAAAVVSTLAWPAWAAADIGHPLPAGVVVQPVPPVLVTRLGRPPAGYEYVLVDGDLVKLAVGTRLVIDAISALVD
jgi:hypothetical protein